MRVIDLKNIKIASINERYGLNPKTGKLFNNPGYKQFKKMLIDELNNSHVKPIEPPYYVDIYIETYLDIDAPVKAILDALEVQGVIINDREVLHLVISKKKLKKGTKSNLQIVVETLCTYQEDDI